MFCVQSWFDCLHRIFSLLADLAYGYRNTTAVASFRLRGGKDRMKIKLHAWKDITESL